MRPMSVNFFLDSNICLYLLGDDDSKKEISFNLLEQNPIISKQVISESVNVILKKYKHLTIIDATKFIEYLQQYCTIEIITQTTITTALKIKERYQLQWYDSLIIAAAIQAGCDTLYSEDMHHGLMVEKSLTIINPFL